MVEVFHDRYEAWDWINKNVGQVMNVEPDGNCGYRALIEACNYTTKYKVDFPDMQNSNEFILNMRKDLRKWCHENYRLFVAGNGVEDEPSIGCGENVSKMLYNPHFNFEEKIQGHPNDSTLILDLFDAAAGKEIYDPAKKDSRYFPAASIHYLDASRHLPFLAYIYKTSVICYKVLNEPKQTCTHYLLMVPSTQTRTKSIIIVLLEIYPLPLEFLASFFTKITTNTL